MKITLSKVFGKWVCPTCGYFTYWSYTDLADKGNPICPEDGDDLDRPAQDRFGQDGILEPKKAKSLG